MWLSFFGIVDQTNDPRVTDRKNRNQASIFKFEFSESHISQMTSTILFGAKRFCPFHQAEFNGAMSPSRVGCTEQSLIGYVVLPRSNRGPRQHDKCEALPIKRTPWG